MKLHISEIMKTKKISIEQLKSNIEMNGGKLSRTSISNIINEKTYPKIDTLYLIAHALDVDIKELFSSERDIYLIVNGSTEVFNNTKELVTFVNDKYNNEEFAR